MITFRDPIHGDLTFDGIIEELIRTEEFQRLAEVKQLGLTDKVYTGATHTRFAHAIGACHLAAEACARLRIPPSDALLIQVAALLHDIGHYDFSHALESIAPCDHEENGWCIIRGTVALPGRASGGIARALRAHGIDPERIVALLAHRDHPAHYGQLLSSPVIDVDRMDYLRRDTYYTGAVIGAIDVSRLLRVLTIHPQTGALGVHVKGVPSMEQFLIARSHMYQQVYLHPDSYAAEAMLRKAVQLSPQASGGMLFGDGHLLARLAEQGNDATRELVRRIRAGKRALHAVAYAVLSDADAPTIKAIELLRAIEHAQPGAFERRVQEAVGAGDGMVLVTFGHAPSGEHATAPAFPVLRDDGTWTDLFAISPLARAVVLERDPVPVLTVHADVGIAARVREAVTRLIDGR